MPRDHFAFRKSEQLKKTDKSLKQGWDARIKDLCEKINVKDDYYTTSSCSGRVVLLWESAEKRDDLFVFVSHDAITFEGLKSALDGISGESTVYFKCDPPILHVACRDLTYAQGLIDHAVRDAGWKRCGILGSEKRFLVELNSTERLEFPIWKGGKTLVDDAFLQVVVASANRKLALSWEKIARLQDVL